jgi:hypothetical protein
MLSRSHPALFEITRSALLLPRSTGGRIRPPQVDAVDFCESNLDKNFWILRKLGPHLVLCPEVIP